MMVRSGKHQPPQKRNKVMRSRSMAMVAYTVAFLGTFLMTFISANHEGFGKANPNNDVTVTVIDQIPVPPLPETSPRDLAQRDNSVSSSSSVRRDRGSEVYSVQAVLSPKKKIVVASGIDAKITELNVENGDTFEKGDVLVEYDCSVDYARLKEARSRQRVTEKQVDAYEKLLGMESVSDMEYLMALENNEQNKALVSQISARLQACKHVAPFDGRVMNQMASQYEYVQTGRVLMEIASNDPLRAEFLIPSKWLRWLNVGTPLVIHIGETDKDYEASIVAVYGEVDPVSQSVQVIAEMESYHEELLPGMSGRAQFGAETVRDGSGGFLGMFMPQDDTRENGI